MPRETPRCSTRHRNRPAHARKMESDDDDERTIVQFSENAIVNAHYNNDNNNLAQTLTCSVYSTRWTPRMMFNAAHRIFRTNERIPGAVTGSSRTFWTVEGKGRLEDNHKNRLWVAFFYFIFIFLFQTFSIVLISLAVCSRFLPDPGPCSTCPFPMPLLSSTTSKSSMIFAGRIFRSSWTSARVTSSAGPPLWLYCCFSFWIVPSVSWQKEQIRLFVCTFLLLDIWFRTLFAF